MKRLLALFAVLLLLLSGCVPLEEPSGGRIPDQPEGTLSVSFLDVGQGDASLIRLPDGRNILIDAGEKQAGETVIQTLTELGITRLDFVVGTHPHTDHIGGLAAVIEAFDIGELYMPRISHDTKTFENLLQTVSDKGLKITPARAGTVMIEEQGLYATFVAPNGQDYEELNDYSAVLRLTFGETSFLFTGDAEAVSEQEMRTLGMSLSADVLKVGHHGSDTSSTVTFLKAVSPTHAVISCGEDNRYGHPHKQTVKRLENMGATVWRTDKHGMVTVSSDGVTLTVSTEK